MPYKVVINEAVELAKSYGGTDGFKYVNGVLDKLAVDARPLETVRSSDDIGQWEAAMDDKLKTRIVMLFMSAGIVNALFGLYVLIEGRSFLPSDTVLMLVAVFLGFTLLNFYVPHSIKKKWLADHAAKQERDIGPAGRHRAHDAVTSEFELIRRYFTHSTRRAVLGVGDDAALVNVSGGCELVISTDMLVAGRHFFRNADPRLLGHKALAVNLSDMAAMGATPRWATLALALPKADTRWLGAFSRGFMALARQHRRGSYRRRYHARPAQHLRADHGRGTARQGIAARRRTCRRRHLGVGHPRRCRAGAGGAQTTHPARPSRTRTLCAKLHRPQPRVALGWRCAELREARSIFRMACWEISITSSNAPGIAAEIEFAALPASEILRRYFDRVDACRALLAGGDDYELCFTAARAHA